MSSSTRSTSIQSDSRESLGGIEANTSGGRSSVAEMSEAVEQTVKSDGRGAYSLVENQNLSDVGEKEAKRWWEHFIPSEPPFSQGYLTSDGSVDIAAILEKDPSHTAAREEPKGEKKGEKKFDAGSVKGASDSRGLHELF